MWFLAKFSCLFCISLISKSNRFSHAERNVFSADTQRILFQLGHYKWIPMTVSAPFHNGIHNGISPHFYHTYPGAYFTNVFYVTIQILSKFHFPLIHILLIQWSLWSIAHDKSHNHANDNFVAVWVRGLFCYFDCNYKRNVVSEMCPWRQL